MKKKHRRRTYIILLLAVLVFSGYQVIRIVVDYSKSQNTYDDLRAQYRVEENDEIDIIRPTFTPAPTPTPQPDDPVELPDPEPEPEPYIIPDHFNDLMEINSDFVGWIEIPGTDISYPVVQGTDNDYYLKRLFTGEQNITGSIFLDFRNNLEGNDQQLLVYGHAMRDGSMFTEINRYANDSYKEEYFYNNNLIRLQTLYDDMIFEVFSVYVVNLNQEQFQTYVRYSQMDNYQTYLDVAMERSVLPSNIEVTTDDTIITLVTCSPWFENSRTLVHGVLRNQY